MPDGLIAAQAGCLVDGVRINTSILQIGFGTRDEESLGLMQDIEPSEIDITAIHDIETAGLESQLIENIHIPQLAVRDVNEGRNRSAQIEQTCAVANAPSVERIPVSPNTSEHLRKISAVSRVLQPAWYIA